MEKTIFLRDVLEDMKKLSEKKEPIPFTIEVREYNRFNKSGGKYKTYRRATLMQPPKTKGEKRLSDPTPFKDARHFKNRTRNIKTEKGIRKINTLFIIKYNHQQVIF